MTEPLIAILLLIIVLPLDIALVSARAGYLNSSQTRLLAIRGQSEVKVQRAEKNLEHLLRTRASLNLMLIFSRFLIAGLAFWAIFIYQPQLAGWLKLILSGLTAILLFWLEWLVEINIIKNPEIWALRMVSFVKAVSLTSYIFLFPWSLSQEARSVTAVPGPLTEDELKNLVDAGQQEGIFELGERRMIYSIFQLGDTLAREIMIPRIDMQALEVNTPLPAAIDALLTSGHSRVPIYEESIDNMLGLLYAKDILSAWYEGDQLQSLHKLIRQAYFVPEAKKVDELLNEMQIQRVHMAIVVDEYGGIAGLVTLEDIVEEIVGEIQDEYDQAEEAPYTEQIDGSYLFLGRVDLDDFNEIVGSTLPKDEAETLGGYIYSQLGRVPGVGEQVRIGDLQLTVEQVSARRIRKVRVAWQKQEIESEEDYEDSDR
ncbi:MAG: hypothetical protein A2Z16_08375 [Chloroflexi bacterium RBG_16_54_18]|nr:MAG: hypothetical protein A2Z16_08375 [Chloroflexi bacterium RBG_16_54_18]